MRVFSLINVHCWFKINGWHEFFKTYRIIKVTKLVPVKPPMILDLHFRSDANPHLSDTVFYALMPFEDLHIDSNTLSDSQMLYYIEQNIIVVWPNAILASCFWLLVSNNTIYKASSHGLIVSVHWTISCSGRKICNL